MTLALAPVVQRLAPVSGPLAGRSTELDRLRDAWSRAVDGRGGLALIAGEAGVGKTRLAAELAAEVEAEGATVGVGVCPSGGAEPYCALVEALGPLPAPEVGDREAVFAALAGTVATRSRRAPMLLVLDDLHRADRSTLLALRHVVKAAAASPVLVVATYRDTALDRSHPLSELLAVVLSWPAVDRIGLDGLSPDALLELVGDADLAGRLWRQSEGNPVRVGELLRLARLDRPLTPAFDEMVAERVEGLSRSARTFLEAAAVAGSQFGVDVVAAAAGLPAEKVPRALKQVVAAGFVVEEPTGPGDARRFVHEMVREAVERGLDPATRVRLHMRIGQALDQGGPGAGAPAALVAWHFRAAAPVGGSAPALAHSARAGDRAMASLAWEEAAVHYGHALAAATGVDADVRADLLLSLGEAQRLAGETARARQAFLEAATLARARQDGTRLARAALALGQVAAVWGADPELEVLAAEARSLLGGGSPGTPTPTVLTDFASGALFDVLDGVSPEPQPPAPPASVVPHAGAPGGAAALLRARHVALASPEHAAERLATADELVALGEQAGDEEMVVTWRGRRMVDLLELGRVGEAAADQAAHARLAQGLGGPRHAADVAAWSAMRALLEGRVEEARSAGAHAFTLAVEAGDPEAEESYLCHRWWVALEWGTEEELAEVVDACVARASTTAIGRTWRAAAALGLARNGRPDLAAEELRRVTDHGLGGLIRDPGRLHPLTCLAEVAWLLGDGYRAAAVGPLLEPFTDRLVVAGRAVVCRGSVAWACGLAAASAHQWDVAERHLQSALAVHLRAGALPLLARSRFEWSRVLVERGRKGDRRKGAESRRKSAELAKRLGMARLLQEIDEAAT